MQILSSLERVSTVVGASLISTIAARWLQPTSFDCCLVPENLDHLFVGGMEPLGFESRASV